MIWVRRLTERQIRAARAHWSLGDVSITLVAARENSVFRVERSNGPAALRLHRPGYRSEAELGSELQWMAMLAGYGIPVPEPIPAPDGTFFLVSEGTVVDLLSWLEGVPLSETPVSEAIYYNLGGLLAQMHDLADGWEQPREFTRPTWDLVGDEPSWGRFWENPTLKPEQRQVFTSFRDRARQDLGALTAPDFGLIHADLIPENVLFHAGRLQPIDFDDGGFGHRLFDLATITHRSRREDVSGALAEATIAGYCRKRPLDLDALPLFEAMRACSYVGWITSRMSEEGAAERNARFVTEAEQRISAFLAV